MKKQIIWIAEVYWRFGDFSDVVWSAAFKDKDDANAAAKSFRRKHDWARKSTHIAVYDLVVN